MRERVEKLLGPGGGGLPWLGTFHSISARMLRTHAELVGLKNNFTILDTDDQVRLLKQIIDAEKASMKSAGPAANSRDVIDSWKNRALTPEKVPKNESVLVRRRRRREALRDLSSAAENSERVRFRRSADAHDRRLSALNPDVLETYHRKITHLMVDEYQDTNVAQYLWLRSARLRHSKNLCVVGDDDQSIYGWRGAEVDNILRFEHDFPGAEGCAAGAQLSLHRPHPRGRIASDREQSRAAGQDALHRRRTRPSRESARRLGWRSRSAADRGRH